MQPLESYDLLDPEVVEDPFEYYAALRAQAPVYQMPSGMWIVSTYDLCLEAIRNYEVFSSQFIQKMTGEQPAATGTSSGPRRCSATIRRRTPTTGSWSTRRSPPRGS